jgi:flavin-dependent dehydrogenase
LRITSRGVEFRPEFVRHVDVLVIGAGPAGAVAATALAAAGAVVALLDRAKVPREKIGESLSPVTAQLLRCVGVGAAVDPCSHLVATGVRRAWGNGITERSFLASAYGRGWLLDRPTFDQALRDFAVRAGVRLVEQADVSRVLRRRSRLQLEINTTSGPVAFSADWVVDCSGRNATVAVRQGAKRINHDKLVAFWRMYRASAAETPDIDRFTTIESSEHGWYYSVPIPGRRRVVAFLTDGDLPICRCVRTEASWSAMLAGTRTIQNFLASGGYHPVTPIRAVLASSTHLDRPAGMNWVAAGDAAIAFDPLSARGICSGTATAANAAAAVLDAQSGRGNALAVYASQLKDLYRDYLTELPRYYESGGTLSSEFWRRRRRSPIY